MLTRMVGRYSCMSDYRRDCAEMTFEDVWREVKGLPDTAILQVPGVLSDATKKKLAERTPAGVEKLVTDAIEEVNHVSVLPLDELVKKRLLLISAWKDRCRG